MSIFDQGFGFGLHHSTSSPHPHLVNLRTSAFAVSPSPPRWTGTICCPQIRSPRSWVFVKGSSLRGLRLSGRARSSCPVFGSSCLRTAARRWLPNTKYYIFSHLYFRYRICSSEKYIIHKVKISMHLPEGASRLSVLVFKFS